MDRQIEPARWAAYLDLVQGALAGHRVRVELVSRRLGDQRITDGMSLRGLSFSPRGSLGPTLELGLGERGEIGHRVVRPTRLVAREDAAGVVRALDIEDADGDKTLVHFEAPLLLPQGLPGTTAPARPVGAGARVRDYMAAPAVTVAKGSSLADAVLLMQQHAIRHLPVVSDGGLIGILSDRDSYLSRGRHGIPLEEVTVDELMTPAPFRVSPEDPLAKAAAVMASRKYGCAVVTSGDQVAGMLSTVDVLRALVEQVGATPVAATGTEA